MCNSAEQAVGLYRHTSSSGYVHFLEILSVCSLQVTSHWWHNYVYSRQCCTFFFFSTLQDKVFWKPDSHRTRCPDDAKTIGTGLFLKTKYMVVNKLWKLKFMALIISLWTVNKIWKLKFMALIISLWTVSLEWFLIMKVLKKHLDQALFMAKAWGLCGLDALVICLLCWFEAWIWSLSYSKLVHNIVKRMGHETTRALF